MYSWPAPDCRFCPCLDADVQAIDGREEFETLPGIMKSRREARGSYRAADRSLTIRRALGEEDAARRGPSSDGSLASFGRRSPPLKRSEEGDDKHPSPSRGEGIMHARSQRFRQSTTRGEGRMHAPPPILFDGADAEPSSSPLRRLARGRRRQTKMTSQPRF